jgi:hypothetical protein
MSTEDRKALPRAAMEVAELLMELASERPHVLDALRSLLLALRAEKPASAVTTDTGQSAEPTTPKVAPEVNLAQVAPPILKPAEAAQPLVEAPYAPMVVEQLPKAAIPQERLARAAVVEPRAKPQPLTVQEQVSLSKLLARFGDPTNSIGLGNASSALESTPLPGRWDEDIDEAKTLARFLRAQARRLKAMRIALHDGCSFPPVDHVLSGARIDDWTTDESCIRRIDAHRLKEGERWYSLTARAAAAIGDWLQEHPQAALGEHRTPEQLKDRLQCLADAQKGVFCWLEQMLGRGSTCGVQARTYATLRAWVDRDYFGVYLPSGMQLSQCITSDRREDIEKSLHRFELEHVEDEQPEAAVATITPLSPRKRAPREGAGETAQSDRFESVLDAFLAAKREFGGELVIFTERAEESAEDSAFMRPDEVHEFFSAMHEIASGLVSGALSGTPLPLLFQELGFRSKHSSAPSMRRFHRFYHMNFEDSEVDLSLHVTLGSRNQNTCLSIHWWHDSERKRFVIGHCGKHLPNSLT